MAAQHITGNGRGLHDAQRAPDAAGRGANVRVAGRLDAGCLGTYHSGTSRNLDIPTLVAGALPLPLPIPEAR